MNLLEHSVNKELFFSESMKKNIVKISKKIYSKIIIYSCILELINSCSEILNIKGRRN